NPGRLPCIRVCGLSGRSKAFSRFYRFEIPRAFPIWLLLHAVGDALLAFARGDLTPPAGGLAAVQIADVGLAAVGLMLLVKGRL
ncbi:MAG: hypothetical protein JXD18_07815, partial [Anaerolineae bacterium]|nr:hypothetical protein [Anaerolineae bacterium]